MMQNRRDLGEVKLPGSEDANRCIHIIKCDFGNDPLFLNLAEKRIWNSEILFRQQLGADSIKIGREIYFINSKLFKLLQVSMSR